VSSPYSVGVTGLPDEERVASTGDWTYGGRRAGRQIGDRRAQFLPKAGIIFLLALSPPTSLADPFAERRGTTTVPFAVALHSHPRRRITIAEARRLALQILAQAETERRQMTEDEAWRAFPLEEVD
jgi:hypothetical protein